MSGRHCRATAPPPPRGSEASPVQRLPLFPLPMVLFPGAPLPLHIFEPRYRQMVARCVEGDGRFGLIYHDPDREGPFQVEEGQVGCVAEILDYQPLPDGRSLIFTRGRERFQVQDGIESETPFQECVASPYSDWEEPALGLLPRRQHSVELFNRVLAEVVNHSRPFPEIDVQEETAFQLAQAIRTDPAWQQTLLELRSERDRLDQVDLLLDAVLQRDPDDED
jgi:Lon protease-like protein